MSRAKKLLDKAKRQPHNYPFHDLCTLVRALGFVEKGGSGSHRFYWHPKTGECLNLQDSKGKAKPYQVRDVVARAERQRLLED